MAAIIKKKKTFNFIEHRCYFHKYVAAYGLRVNIAYTLFRHCNLTSNMNAIQRHNYDICDVATTYVTSLLQPVYQTVAIAEKKYYRTETPLLLQTGFSMRITRLHRTLLLRWVIT